MKIKFMDTVKEIYNKLKKVLEGKIAINFWLLYVNNLNYHFNNRKTTIVKYIMNYEKL